MSIMWMPMEIYNKKEIVMLNKIFSYAVERKDINYSVGYINGLFDFDLISSDEYVTLFKMIKNFYETM